MSSNPSPPPPSTTATTSQSDSKNHISHETPPIPPQSDSETQISLENPTTTTTTSYISHEKKPLTCPIPPSQSDSKTHLLPELGLTNQRTKDELFEKVMREYWSDVVNIYKEKKDIAWTASITRNKETALHIAISDSKTEVVKRLLDIIDPIKIREMMNDMDENPLHLAASLGQAETCKQLVEKDPELIGARNKEGETPLFQAALHGKKKAFYALHPKCPITGKDIKHDIVHCKRTDGNSILHVAIQGEYFGLAYQIIYWYPELIKFYNEKGLTALHFLAQNPSAFRSGCHLGPFDDFIYRCLVVDLDEVETPSHFKDELCLGFDFPVPGNYQTCLDLLKLWKDIFTVIAKWAPKWEDIKHDICKIFNKDEEKHQLPVTSTGKDKKQAPEEPSPEGSSKHCDRSHIDIEVGDEMKEKRPQKETQKGQKEEEIQKESQEEEKDSKKLQKKDDSTEQPQYPSNYNVFFNFVEFAMEFFLFVLGLGYSQVRKIKDKKQKHKLVCQIMKKLIHNTKFWVYVGSGSAPVTGHSSVVSYSLQNEPSVDASEHSTEVKEPKETKRESKDKDEEKTVKDILSVLPGKEVLLEAEKTRPDVYRLKMLKNDSQEDGDNPKRSPVLIAVKMGVKEMVEEILNKFPVAIRDEDADKKNVVLLAVENRHPKIYKLLLNKYYNSHESVFQKVDKDGNSAIHLAATIGKNQFWRIPGAALQMQWELKWYKYIKTSMPRHFFAHRNKERKTSREVFAETHRDMIKDGGTWLTNTSQSCSVVAALITTVAYASATTVPGGAEGGKLALRGHPAFDIFTIASLIALCLSVTSLTMFLSILTSRYQVPDFLNNLPTKLILGLTSLFISIAAMLVSFCAGHFFDLEDRLRQTAYPIYAITCLPVSIYAIAQFPLYLDLIKSTIITVPKRSYEVTSF
ncbi:hypothetical protein AAC387_Pa03g0528 [Persea americana]